MIETKNLSRKIGNFALEAVDLNIEEGEYFCVLGPTGSGKTILMETIAGIYKPDNGSIIINGKEISSQLPKERNISMVYQDFMLFPNMDVRKNIEFGLHYKGFKKSRITEMVENTAKMLGISHLLERRPLTLSGGEKQRTAIARAIITEPELLLLDEPLSSLDTGTKDRIGQELLRIHQLKKTTTIHVTHSFEEAFSLADRIAVMHDGKILQVGTAEEVFNRPNSRFIADFVGVENLFHGKAFIQDNLTEIYVNDLKIISSTLKSGDVSISIRPENILVSINPIESSARNSFSGVLTQATRMKSIVNVIINAGIPFRVVLTKRTYDDMELSIGREVYLTFSASAVHII
ncbi:ABC transporter ATP-binding protein [Methanohalophilus halophilus]|uniref:Molybdate/tungstate import ATP-binding protein WtpC n=1 Tax=Methanohalophilus halophilus TaxID=2177 RepID=A0A1L3Q314_9EURY|nr:ABC transporter ATP-binding protein [Methanohalophilus halophilus]APH39258.1 ABC transporter [Methanohalophilus halophilus]RNI09679.1 ABC transporter ATP-binding protein [Methanohalophilus halophilus]SDW52425.1 molybdate/tungstate transport system ATP-binding protein [Methanohalophilus halophilus]